MEENITDFDMQVSRFCPFCRGSACALCSAGACADSLPLVGPAGRRGCDQRPGSIQAARCRLVLYNQGTERRQHRQVRSASYIKMAVCVGLGNPLLGFCLGMCTLLCHCCPCTNPIIVYLTAQLWCCVCRHAVAQALARILKTADTGKRSASPPAELTQALAAFAELLACGDKDARAQSLAGTPLAR